MGEGRGGKGGGGGGGGCSKAWGLGAALRSPVGPGQRPGGGSGGSCDIFFILEVKFNHIVSPHR